MASISADAVGAWLDSFSHCVRTGNLEAGRALFSPEARGFGTVVTEYDNTDDLVERQWGEVWPRTADFTFDQIQGIWSDEKICTVAAAWSSVGIEGRRPRTGRVTLVLRRCSDGSLRAVHSHFSMTPGTLA